MNRRILIGFTLSVAVLFGGFLPLAAQDKDERAAREEVARQALEQQIASLLKQADKLKDKPEESLPLLEKAAKLMKDTTVSLGLSRRAEMDDMIDKRIKALKNTIKPTPPATGGSGKEDDYQQQLNTLNQLRKQGRDAEAKELAEKLNKQYPDRTPSTLSRGSTSMAEQAKQQSEVSRAKASGSRSAMTDVEKSAGNIPPDGVISYPKDFKEKTDKRPGMLANKMSPEEKKLLILLDENTKEPAQFKDAPFEQVLKYLEDNLGLKLQLSKSTLDEVQLDYSRPITVNIPKGLNKRSVLKLVLGDLDLAYVIKDNQLVVMSAQRAAKEVVTKPYYLKDLRGTALQQVANMIENSIEPNSWRKAGGPGHIVVDDKNGVLWITNTAEIVGRIFNR